MKSKSYISINYLSFLFLQADKVRSQLNVKCQFVSYVVEDKHNYSFVQTASLNLQQLTSPYTDLESLASSHMRVDY